MSYSGGKLTTSKKWQLLGALYRYGNDENTMKNSLGGKLDLKKIISSYQGRANRLAEKSGNEPIDNWIELLSHCHEIEETKSAWKIKNLHPDNAESEEPPANYNSLIPKSMLYAACFEEHYQGESPNDPNYNEIYRYLYQLLSGKEPTQLRPGNAKKMLQMMGKLKNFISDKKNVESYVKYIKSESNLVSYLKDDVDIPKILEEKKETMRNFNADELSDDESSELDDTQLLQSEIILKKQLKLAKSIEHMPGMNPIEIDPSVLVKPSRYVATLADGMDYININSSLDSA